MSIDRGVPDRREERGTSQLWEEIVELRIKGGRWKLFGSTDLFQTFVLPRRMSRADQSMGNP